MAMLADIHSRSCRVWGSSDPEQLYVYMGSRAKKILDQLVLWEAAHNSSKKCLQSLTNLADQLQATRTCDQKGLWQKTQLGQFQDLIIRLNYKQVQAMEALMNALKTDLMTCNDITNTIARFKASAFSIYQKYADEIQLQDAVMPTATCPALVDLLDWYLTKKRALHDINYEDIDTINTMQELWNENDCIHYLKDAREQIGVFLSKAF
ncbi:uncharacterized protein TRIADDRAFT_55563 [Trichoplax adhaerens]|uniref:Uncharacterized protein n=1 Tax=Trichoplax adhaerens TaxID=10228 RepID=B3RV85_TRIAD|nr:hypothetical protein TRIADDRAFT_55563 [Trichoplax adhaerens]EDV25948.1 hypothetical protein TRIADDRAFT_55563 [Trichoplax adhaerens]|eukprot:XP_002111981.1 hypothetical protein TRIADDRAFT_55563 [Trichoplax adhaerens]